MAKDNLSKYSRQLQLREIGPEGQNAILQAPLVVDSSIDKAGVRDAKLYGRAAGLCCEHVVTETSCLSPSIRECFRHPSSAALGLGASSALDSIHRALHSELGSTSR